MVQEGNVKICPITKKEWEEHADAKSGDCGGQSVYHCLADSEGRKWERCVEKSLVKEGNCPIFTSKGFIDWNPCNLSINTCPNRSYFSNEVYKYPRCFGNNNQREEVDGDQDLLKRISNVLELSVGIGLGILFIVAAVLIVAGIYIRRKRLNSDTQDDLTVLKKLISDGESLEGVNRIHLLSGLDELSHNEVRSIVVLGKFGNLVSSTSRRISERFKLEKKWKSFECRYTDIPNTVEENTIMYVYGWFGLWNDDLCSVGRAKMACTSLIRILNETNNVKLIVGMRSDLYKKYHQELEEVDDGKKTSLFHHEIYLDTLEVYNDNAYKKYFEKNIQKQCKENNCTCKRFAYEVLRKGKDRVVGMPLKIQIMKTYHEIIPTYLDNLDILKAMSDHFSIIQKEKERKYVYEWIMYICLKGKFCRSDPYDTDLVKEMSFEIEQSSFDENDTELCRYVRMRNSDKLRDVPPENAQYVFWHPFIYMSAFHFLFHQNPELVIKHCNVDAILQLVRPKEVKTSYFEIAADNRCVTLFNERLSLLGKEEEYANHPLVQMVTKIEEVEAFGIGISMALND